MSNKFKPWQQRQPKRRRNTNAQDMFSDHNSGSRDRRSRHSHDQEDPRFYERNNRYFGNLDDVDNEDR